MRCASCGFENPEGMNFCEECGAKLVRACPNCGHEVRPTAKFCGNCGTVLTGQAPAPDSRPPIANAQLSVASFQSPARYTPKHLAERILAEQAAREARGTPEGERKTITALFADLKGSTALIEGLDPEEARSVLDPALQLMMDAVHRYDGYVAQALGDGIFALFGAPLAHEDHPQRALYAALRMQEEMRRYADTLREQGRPPLLMRIGLNTGEVVVRSIRKDDLHADYVPVGHSTNLAARMEQLAAPGAILVTEQTYRLTEGYFAFKALGKTPIKLTSQGGCLLLEAFSVSYGKASPYLPVIELLKAYFDITVEDDERRRREKVGGKVLMLDRSLEDSLPFLFALLGIADPEATLQQMDPQIRRRRTFEALKRLMLRESLKQPLLLIFEDLHWIDAETQGFLDTLSESIGSARILLLANYRPEYRHEWGQKTYYTQLRLTPLGKAEAEEFLTVLLGEEAALKPLKQLILEKTEGTPFFMEEVVQTLVEERVLVGERGHYRVAHAPTALHISPTVHGVLAARIDRLAPAEKELLQHLAVIGREFPLSLLRQVVTQPEEEFSQLLLSLQHKEFLYEHPAFPEVEYIFKHALTQEVAYGSVLQERRKAVHEQTAKAMEALYRANLGEHYSELAHHYSRSGNIEKAVKYLHLAGEQAVQHSANTEAISHLTAALDLLKTLPDTPERIQQELTLQIALGVPLRATKGYAASEVGKAYTRARELCQEVGENPQLFMVLLGLWAFYAVRAEHRTARELAEQLLGLAQRKQDSALFLQAHYALGWTWLFLGEWAPSREHSELGIALYDPQQHRSLAFLYGQDFGVTCLDVAAWALWHLGYPDQALKRSNEAFILARELSHPYSLAQALDVAAMVHQFRREGRAAQERAEAMIALSSEQGFALWVAWGTILRGWAITEQGQREDGIVQIRQGLAAFQATGAEVFRPYFLALLAEACGKAGQTEGGLNMLAEALAAADKTGERWYEAELYRLKGELSLKSRQVKTSLKIPTPDPQAEACFLKAIDIARRQSAKSLELRAVMSLSRLWQQQGNTKEAHQMLAEIYAWFTEGFDTKDLQEAKALLEELV